MSPPVAISGGSNCSYLACSQDIKKFAGFGSVTSRHSESIASATNTVVPDSTGQLLVIRPEFGVT